MNANVPLTMLGRYQIVRVLGRGAMGQVYEARDPRLGRPVAIKTILKGHLLDDTLAEEYSARFVREAQAAARLNHPNIVTVFDFGEEADVAYLVMEFVRGRELAQRLEGGERCTPEEAVRIVGELLDALDYAHAQGVVHRDVKPANVMLDASGHVKLTDFGVARMTEAGHDRTEPGTMVGTPSYMAPEQIQGAAVGSRADIFAAGVVLYQCLTGERPFGSGGPFVVQKRIVHDEPLPPSRVNRALAPQFDAIVARALAKSPAARYETAAQFAAALRGVGTVREPAPAPPAADADATVVLPRRAPTLTQKIVEAPPARAARIRPAASRRYGAWAAVGLAALAAAWLGASWLSRPGVVPAPSASASTPPTPAPTATPSAPSVTQIVAAPPAASEPAHAEPSPIATNPMPAPAVAKASTPNAIGGDKTASRSRSEPRSVAPSSRRVDARCAELLERVQLGEPLSADNQNFFTTECRR